jgi:hypothetical protein
MNTDPNQRAKRKKENLIRLDDLIPKQDVTGGHQCSSVLLALRNQSTSQQRTSNKHARQAKETQETDQSPGH